MRLTSILIAATFCICLSTNALAIERFKSKYSFGFNYQLRELNSYSKESSSFNGFANLAGGYLQSEFDDIWSATIGLDYNYIKDESPFYVEVKDSKSNATSIKSSKVFGFSTYAEVGYAFIKSKDKRLRANVNIGGMYSDINRTISRCNGCPEDSQPQFGQSWYIKPTLEYAFSEDIHWSLHYVFYSKNTGFKQGLGFNIKFYSY